MTMIVPLKLSILAQHRGQLSPELALGWRLGHHAHDCFDGLDQVLVAAVCHPDTRYALAGLTRYPEPGAVIKPVGARPWDILFFHQPTGTALKVVFIQRQIKLSAELKTLEDEPADCDSEILHHYQEGVDALIQTMLSAELEQFCFITEIRCRVLVLADKQPVHSCPWCRKTNSATLLDVDGRICCPACAGLEQSWIP